MAVGQNQKSQLSQVSGKAPPEILALFGALDPPGQILYPSPARHLYSRQLLRYLSAPD
jgi:hypothetical protein